VAAAERGGEGEEGARVEGRTPLVNRAVARQPILFPLLRAQRKYLRRTRPQNSLALSPSSSCRRRRNPPPVAAFFSFGFSFLLIFPNVAKARGALPPEGYLTVLAANCTSRGQNHIAHPLSPILPLPLPLAPPASVPLRSSRALFVVVAPKSAEIRPAE